MQKASTDISVDSKMKFNLTSNHESTDVVLATDWPLLPELRAFSVASVGCNQSGAECQSLRLASFLGQDPEAKP